MSARDLVIGFLNQGITSPKELQQRTKVSLRTIKFIKKKWLQTGSSADRPRSGRPKKLGAEDHKRISALLRHHPDWNSKELAEGAAAGGSPAVCERTMRNELNRMERDYGAQVYRPLLTERHILNRLAFANAHLRDNWKRTIFTDETSFFLYRNKVKIWR